MTCPQCGSPSPFKPRRRTGEHELVVFVSCPACPYEQVLRSGPRDLVELEVDVDRLRGRVEAGEAQLGSVLRAREARLERLRLDLVSGSG